MAHEEITPSPAEQAFSDQLEGLPYNVLFDALSLVVDHEAQGDQARVAELKDQYFRLIVRQSPVLRPLYESAFGPMPSGDPVDQPDSSSM